MLPEERERGAFVEERGEREEEGNILLPSLSLWKQDQLAEEPQRGEVKEENVLVLLQ